MSIDHREAGHRWSPGASPGVRAAFYFFCFCAAILFSYIYFQMTSNPDAELAALAHGEGVRPFQYRVLVPFIAGTIERLSHIKIHRIYAVLTIIATFCSLVAFRRYLRLMLPASHAALLAFVLLYPLFWNYSVLSGNYNPADIPAVLFFTLGLTAIHQRRMVPYYIIFIVATFNRETSCFLTFALLLWYWKKLPLPALAAHCLAQLVIWVAIKAFLFNLFADNPGDPVFQNAIGNNITFLGSLLRLHPPSVFKLFVFGCVWTLIPLAWRSQPQFYRRLLWVTVPFLAGMSIVGVLSEVRIYSELIPVLLAPALYSIHQRWLSGPEGTPRTA